MPTAQIQPANGAATMEIAPYIFMQLPALLTVDDEPGPGLQTLIEFTFNSNRGRVQATTVAVRSSPAGDPVTGTDLRAVRVADLTAEHLPKLARKLDGSPVTPSREKIAGLVARGPSDGEVLLLVADLYSYADAVGLRPAKHVQETLGLPSATASRWIRRAREAGLFDRGTFTIEDVDDGDD
ncbi:hypothetical protein [Rhodococcus gordoniae]|uniref:hypothetical protein n=1 Tax=Rhodococcus gordoniae TaxID=223392 RepID=UPI0020CEC272|nr:hypothetical protein [Rhodococcus gordoniae]UTT48841.1 hypothetical protein NMQ04_01045 [Rhodococcus gordoniae]